MIQNNKIKIYKFINIIKYIKILNLLTNNIK